MIKHIWHYSVLIILLILGFGFASSLHGNTNYQLEIVSITALFYILWGILHQALHHNFSFKIMLEYFAVGILGVSIIYFVISVGL